MNLKNKIYVKIAINMELKLTDHVTVKKLN